MKSFFEKHDLFKIVGIMVVIAVLLTWLVSTSYYDAGILVSEGFTRVGLFDFSDSALNQVFYFAPVIMYVFVVAGFYKFLGSIPAYDKLKTSIAAKLKGKEKIVVALSILIFACLSGISVDYVVLFGIIPFVITILSKLSVDKITGLAATYGGVLVGILGASYSTLIVGSLVEVLKNVNYGFDLISTVIIFTIAYLLLTYFTFSRMNKVKESKNVDVLNDSFALVLEDNKKDKKSKKDNSVSTMGLIIVLSLTFLMLILAFIGWDEAFGIYAFTDAYNWLTRAELFGQPVYSYILGSVFAVFGSWDLIDAACVILVASLVIKLVYHIPFDKMIDEYGKGLMVIGKSVVILMMIFLVFIITMNSLTTPFFIGKIMGLGNNIGTIFASSTVSTLFTPYDFYYTLALGSQVYTSFSDLNVAALAIQSAHGIVSFIAPTSIILMLGLSNLSIKFSDYFKFIWKFILATLIIVFIILAILIYV